MPGVLIGGNMRIINNLPHTLRLGLVSAAEAYDRSQQSHGHHPTSYSQETLQRTREAFYKSLHQAVKASTLDTSLVPDLEAGFADFYEPRISSHRANRTSNVAICNAAELEYDAMNKARENRRDGVMSL